VTVSQALSSARDIGFTDYAGKRGLYAFTPLGREYTRALTGGAEKEARDRLRDIILNNPKWAGIVGFLRTNKGVPRTSMDLVIDLERRLGKQWSTGMRTNVATAMVSILQFAGLVKTEGGKIVSLLDQDGIQPEVGPTPMTVERASGKDTWRVFSRTPEPTPTPGVDFADYKDQNVVIRVKKELQYVLTAKRFLDFVEAEIRASQTADQTKDSQADPQNQLQP